MGAHFTTEAYAPLPSVAAWRETLKRFSLRPTDETVSGLQGIISSAQSPHGILFGLVASGPQAWANRDEKPGGLWLVLHMEGEASLLTQAGRSRLAPGDLVYGPAGAPAELSMTSDFRQLLVKFPADVLAPRLARPLSSQAGMISNPTGIERVLSGLLASVAVTIGDLGPDQLRSIDIALPELLAASLAQERGGTVMVAATSGQTAILNRISQLIEARLDDADLTLVDVAKSAGVSVRYLQKLFEAANDNFGRYLRSRRLERCRADLINPVYAHLSITDICFRWGFNDGAHFSRAFREQYGMSPKAYRSRIGDTVSRSVLDGASRGWPDITHDAYKRLTRNESFPRLHSPDQPALPAEPEDERAVSTVAAIAGGRHHHLPANSDTVHWGYLSHALAPVLEISSGDHVTIETLSHHCGDDHERMIAGDPGAESVYHWTAAQKNMPRRGAGPMSANIYGRGSGEGFGVHICTGPIAVSEAEPGDVIEVRILDISPRPCANPQYGERTFGSNAAAWWGFHYSDLLTEPKPREVVTVYEVDCSRTPASAKAVYSYRWTPQTDPDGVVHPRIDYPGVCVDHSTIVKTHDVLKNVRIPVNPHFGFIALAPREAVLVDSIPPSYFGGNLDDKRATAGASLYLPVSVPKGLLSIGDPHASQGDGEVCGTAIECSLNGTFQIIVHKKGDQAGKPFDHLSHPLLETQEAWVMYGFTHSNYLSELGQTAQSEIYKKSSLDPAMRDAFRKMRRFLMTAKGLSEDEAISLMSVAVDFGVTQVVDGNWCVHAILNKSLFVNEAPLSGGQA